jgi:acetolactate synthase-1/2/3 large subunit
MSRATVAAVVADGLARAGARRLFAAAGAPAAVVEAARAHGLIVVDVAGVTAACLMAAVTGELEDAPGAVAASLAGGVTGMVDGAAHATRDRAPVIILSDGAAEPRLLEPVTKASLVADAASAGHWIAHAAQLATAAPRGAVHLAVRPEVATAPTLPVAASCRRAPLPPPPAATLDALAEAIAGAARPLLVAGLEVGEDDAKWLRALAETVPAPVLCTPKGKGALPDPHPLALGLLAGDHPLVGRADLLVALGVDPVELGPGAWPAGIPIARVGHAPAAGDLERARIDVVADIGLVIEELAPRLRGRGRADWDVAELDRVKRALRAAPPPGPGLARRRVVELAREATPAGTLVTLDVPLAQAWQAVAPRELLIPSGVATTGFALPAAVGAALAREGRRVVAIGAAAGYEAMAGELATVARLGVPIIAIALNHAGATPALLERARAAGLAAWVAADEAAFGAAFARAFAGGRPALIDAHVVR